MEIDIYFLLSTCTFNDERKRTPGTALDAENLIKALEMKLKLENSFTGAAPPHAEQKPEHGCEHFVRHCNSLRCPYGILKSYDGSCERCECEDPCADYECPIDSKCSVDITDQEGATVFVPVCRKYRKSGQCPRLEQQTSSCEVECHDDADCRGDYKCCSAGCSNVCTAPIDERIRPTTQAPHHPEAREPALEEVPEEDLRPVGKEGDVATLRCFATGFPPPSITWRRGGLEVCQKNF